MTVARPGALASAFAEISLPDKNWRLGNYEILEEIGRGGMGVIYRARQRHSRRIVAVKRVLGYHADSRETLARFRREAQAAASLDHPNILPIYEVSESEDGLPFFSMKFAPGGSLQEVGPALRNEPRQCVALVAKIARAVQHAHGKGILHRDLKPGNILLDAHGEPLVSDFGLAKWLDTTSDLTRTLTIFGTPGYIAPEQASGPAAQLKPAADVYSLGAILFDLLAGRPPFLGTHALSVIRQAAESPAPKLRTLSKIADRDLETICAHCLEREPSARYPSAHDLAEDLERWLEGRPIIARPVSPPVRVWRWSRRNRRLAGSLAACLLLGSAAIAWLVQSQRLGATMREGQLTEHSLLVFPLLDLDEVTMDSEKARSFSDSFIRGCSAINSIRVRAYGREKTTAAGFSWKDADLRRTALSNGSRAYLIGTVRNREGRLRVVFNLVEAGSGCLLARRIVDGDLMPMASSIRELTSEWKQNAGREGLPHLRTDLATATKSERARNYLIVGDDLTRKRDQENFDRAIDAYRKAIGADPHCALAHASLASALAMRTQFKMRSGDLSESLILAQKAVELGPSLSEAHRAQAVAYTMSGHFSEAVEASIKAFELDPTYQRAPGLLGALSDLMGRPDLALRWFDWASRMQNQPAEYGCNIASALQVLEEDGDAEQALSEYAEFRPELPDSVIGRISLRIAQQRFDEALELARGVVKKYPADINVRQSLSEAAFFAGQMSEAETEYRKLLEEDRHGGLLNSPVSYASAMGWICVSTSREKEGRTLLNDARQQEIESLKLAPNHPRHLYSLAAICAALGKEDDALGFLKRAIEHGWVNRRFAQIDPRFSVLRKDSRFEKALAELDLRVRQLRRQRPAVKLVSQN